MDGDEHRVQVTAAVCARGPYRPTVQLVPEQLLMVKAL